MAEMGSEAADPLWPALTFQTAFYANPNGFAFPAGKGDESRMNISSPAPRATQLVTRLHFRS